MECKCILQTGLNAGKECGKNVQPGQATCGIHKKKCLRTGPEKKGRIPVRKGVKMHPRPSSSPKVTLDRKIIISINNIIVNAPPGKISTTEFKRVLEREHGPIDDIGPYMKYASEVMKAVKETRRKCDELKNEVKKIMPRYSLIA